LACAQVAPRATRSPPCAVSSCLHTSFGKLRRASRQHLFGALMCCTLSRQLLAQNAACFAQLYRRSLLHALRPPGILHPAAHHTHTRHTQRQPATHALSATALTTDFGHSLALSPRNPANTVQTRCQLGGHSQSQHKNIIQVGPIVASEDENGVTVCDCRRALSPRRKHTRHVNNFQKYSQTHSRHSQGKMTDRRERGWSSQTAGGQGVDRRQSKRFRVSGFGFRV
jgi:hypothetical protein